MCIVMQNVFQESLLNTLIIFTTILKSILLMEPMRIDDFAATCKLQYLRNWVIFMHWSC